MNIPKLIEKFIQKEIEFESYLLPNFYPKVEVFLDFQAGYKEHGNTAETITGEKKGDFKESWFVICSGYARDPFFIDYSEAEKNFPVYFAWKGAGSWTPIKVADSILEFTDQLLQLQKWQSDSASIQTKIKQYFDIKNECWSEVYMEYRNDD